MSSTMDTETQRIVESIKPLEGDVVHIKTVQETQPVEEYGKHFLNSGERCIA